VSTADQTLEHQRTRAVVADYGVSWVRTALRDRPGKRRLFDMLRAGDSLVVRWVDRLGRNYADVTDTQGPDATGRARFPDCLHRATAQAQAEAITEAQEAGIVHAQMHDDGSKYRGRKPTFRYLRLRKPRD
jgi:putative DNA-invertase from lambdoid prophage Rac